VVDARRLPGGDGAWRHRALHVGTIERPIATAGY
jgi:hypothetical protein